MEPGGIEAREAMIELIRGEDVSEILVRRGLARGYPRSSGERYAEPESRAASNSATISEV